MRAVLDKYQSNGGKYHEEVLADCGHSPHLEKAEEVTKLLLDFFQAH
jgi:pimeloyl-ACP methyl ester carboxylesterase